MAVRLGLTVLAFRDDIVAYRRSRIIADQKPGGLLAPRACGRPLIPCGQLVTRLRPGRFRQASRSAAASASRQVITEWVGGAFEELPDQVRIILVSAEFSTEITSTVIWLNQTYNTDISCYQVIFYVVNGKPSHRRR